MSNKILLYLLSIIPCFFIAFLLSWAIVVQWELFWDYGYDWNTITAPPRLLLHIFMVSIETIILLAIIITPIVFGLGFVCIDCQ